LPDAAEMAEIASADLRERGLTVFPISTKTGEGLTALTFAMAELVSARRAAAPEPAAPRIVIRPRPVAGRAEFTVTREGEYWRVHGEKPERWVRQTDFGNAEAVGYLADRLNRIGIEDRLLELGARAGDGVAIGGADAVVFDFSPQIEIGAEILSRRGEDQRFAEERPAAQRRRDRDREYHAAEEDDGPSTSSGPVDA
jgi:GTP-binding protein